MTEHVRGQATHYLSGVVIVPARSAHFLERLVDLAALRVRHRGKDPELDRVLHALHIASLDYQERVSGTGNFPAETRVTPAPPRETDPPSELLGSSEAAARLELTSRRITQLAKQGEIEAEIIAGRWLFRPEAIENYNKGRA